MRNLFRDAWKALHTTTDSEELALRAGFDTLPIERQCKILLQRIEWHAAGQPVETPAVPSRPVAMEISTPTIPAAVVVAVAEETEESEGGRAAIIFGSRGV
jgi:hypothetical protein